MPRFQLLRCDVALAGEKETIVSRHRDNPVPYPELLVIQRLHGGDAISDVAVVGEWEASNEQMLDRIRVIYPEGTVEKVFPGAKPVLPLGDRTLPRCNRPVYVPKPTKPENPDPVVLPLSRLEPDEDTPVVHVTQPFVEEGDSLPLPLAETDAGDEMESLFGADLNDRDEGGDGFTPLSDEASVQQTIGAVLAEELRRQQQAEAAPRAATPDPAAFRAGDKTRGRINDATSQQAYPHDVAGGGMKPKSTAKVRARHGLASHG